MERCANCGDKIGNLETPHVWKDKVVCKPCYVRLSDINPAPPEPAPTPVIPYSTKKTAELQRAAASMKDFIICPNPHCGYQGAARRVSKGSGAVLILLLLLWVIPGLIYFVVYYGYELQCPRCGIKVRDVH